MYHLFSFPSIKLIQKQLRINIIHKWETVKHVSLNFIIFQSRYHPKTKSGSYFFITRSFASFIAIRYHLHFRKAKLKTSYQRSKCLCSNKSLKHFEMWLFWNAVTRHILSLQSLFIVIICTNLLCDYVTVPSNRNWEELTWNYIFYYTNIVK